MPPIEVGPAGATGAVSARLARTSGGETLPGANGVVASSESSEARSTAPAASTAVEASAALDPGQIPVDSDRVELIRKALENGTYPVIPTQIADAMIAAGVLLRSHQE
ncbi:negative regulator of flagellin synthesis FlgM [Novosphingobium sp. PhB165]|uniref:flagellar biosynthesis anti-sigma factor FlgM n=1 Tax=Novosphingobium sp. PhB165 TaxID=2485105 RepID=UPI0010503050|nr:flagellar biosynthesis anti-sigma factor FlgM [Novosphingobium sp. PhB165]TCM18885.1 negative regulator of flagellin synthesis FlgM [Novosphingobium sp. PhB165]